MSIIESAAAGVRCVRAADGDAFWTVGDTYTIKASASITGGAYSLVEASVPPGSGPPPHVHTREDEAFYILDGQLEFTAGEQTVLAGAGDFIYLPRGDMHRFTNPGIFPARALMLLSPGGFEGFFRDAGIPARPGEPAPPLDPADAPRLASISARFGGEIHM